VITNDSPEDASLSSFLATISEDDFGVECVVITNRENVGFIRSVNRGLSLARESGHHALILNSDTVVFEEWLPKMIKVLDQDEKIGFVCPRSNNATIATYPQMVDVYAGKSPSEAYRTFTELSRGLPEYTYVPLPVGFCMLIRDWIIKDLGLLDEVYSPGYNEENDFAMKANRFGVVSAIANRAFVYHEGEASFNLSPTLKKKLAPKNSVIFDGRFPESSEALNRFFQSPRFLAEVIWGATGNHRPRITFDFTNLYALENGTSNLGRNLAQNFSKLFSEKYELFAFGPKASLKFHNLEKSPFKIIDSTSGQLPFSDVIIRVGQVFTLDWLVELRRKSRKLFIFMLDPIAWDTQDLSSNFDPQSWEATFILADKVPAISSFARHSFIRRFPNTESINDTEVIPSLSFEDYRKRDMRLVSSGPSSPGYILVMGNKFRHKFVTETVDSLASSVEHRIYSIGGSESPSAANRHFASGSLSGEAIQQVVMDAELIVFPSLYEGFGFPVIESIANGKTVFARDTEVNRELMRRLGNPAGLILYSSNEHLVNSISSFTAVINSAQSDNPHSWSESAMELEKSVEKSLQVEGFLELQRKLTLASLFSSTRSLGDPIGQLFAKLESRARTFVRKPWVFKLAKWSWPLIRRLMGTK
jgi:glycosyltransferase involved in cell wall biosynthesis